LYHFVVQKIKPGTLREDIMAPEIKAAAGPVKLTLSYKLIWGVAGLGTALISGTFGALAVIFYQDYIGLSAGWIALALGIYAVWNAINDPLFGIISDNTRSKHGRRIPYMRIFAPFLALSFILVWFVPPQASQEIKFLWLLITICLYDGCYTMIGLVYSALLPEVTESDSERNGLQISSSLFGLLGMLGGFLIPDMVRPKAGTDTSLVPLQIAMIVIGVLAAVLILITTLKVKERPEFASTEKPLGLKEMIRYTFTSRSFIVLALANFFSILMQSLILAAVFYLSDYVLKMSTITVLIFLFVPLIIGVPVTTFIRRWLGVVRAQQFLLVIAGVGLILVVIVPTPMILFCLALAGFGLSGPQTLTNIMFAQVADEDELRSGVRREGAFFGVNALITKPAQSIAGSLIPAVLAMTSFVTRDANGGQIFLNQPEAAIFGMKVLVGLIPGVAMLIGALILQLYPLRGARLEKMQAEVLVLHAKKREQYESLK
jgi:GPH family glycoside/pentoside/hexuronide:cation symporter